MVQNVVQIKIGIIKKIDASAKNIIYVKIYIWNPATCSCKNGKYLKSIIVDSVITCDEITDAEVKLYNEETETVEINFNEKNAICKVKNFNILFAFLLITIALLIAVSTYCYLIKYQAKQKNLLPFHVKNNYLMK